MPTINNLEHLEGWKQNLIFHWLFAADPIGRSTLDEEGLGSPTIVYPYSAIHLISVVIYKVSTVQSDKDTKMVSTCRVPQGICRMVKKTGR